MKIYIVKLLVIIAITLAIVCGITLIVYKLVSKFSFEVSKEKNILIIGDSSTECAIDDSIWENAINVSKSGTHLLFSYIKIKRIVNDNPQIDTLILSILPSTISKALDERWLSGEAMKSHLRFTSFYGNLEDYNVLFDDNDYYLASVKSSIALAPVIAKRLLTKSNNIKDLKIGQYVSKKGCHLEKIIEKANKKTPGSSFDIDSYQFEYLKRIEKFCDEKNIKLILLSTPIYKPDVYVDVHVFDSLRREVIPQIDYYDFTAFPLADSCYLDMIHLNNYGSRVFSRFLQDTNLSWGKVE